MKHYTLNIKPKWAEEQLEIIDIYLDSEQGERDKITFCNNIDIEDVQLLFSELKRCEAGPEQIGDD